MTTKTKTFDCVEMKRKAQEALQAEYHSRRGEFASFSDFLNAKIRESEQASAIWDQFSGGERTNDSYLV